MLNIVIVADPVEDVLEGISVTARCFETITQALGDIIGLFSVAECRNFFKAAGYEAE